MPAQYLTRTVTPVVRYGIDGLPRNVSEYTVDGYWYTEDLMSRGDCQDEIAPLVNGETDDSAVAWNATWERSAEIGFENTYSYKFIKTSTEGIGAHVDFQDSISNVDMHGFLLGQTITFRVKIYIPAASGLMGSEINLQMLQFVVDPTKTLMIYDAPPILTAVGGFLTGGVYVIRFEPVVTTQVYLQENYTFLMAVGGLLNANEQLVGYAEPDLEWMPTGTYAQNVYDTWQELTCMVTLGPETTGVAFRLEASPTASANDYLYVGKASVPDEAIWIEPVFNDVQMIEAQFTPPPGQIFERSHVCATCLHTFKESQMSEVDGKWFCNRFRHGEDKRADSV